MVPLPSVPQRIGRDVSADNVGLRRFGIFEGDLCIEFSSANRAALATRLLEACTVDPAGILPDYFYGELSTGKRIECLLVLATGGADTALGFPFKCAGCGEEIELELTLREISEIQGEADLVDRVGVEIGGRPMAFRIPTGRDQQMWSQMIFKDEDDARAGLIGTLAAPPESSQALEPDELDAVEVALDQADPLVNFSCRVACGECGELNDRKIDLLETALGMLSRAQHRLIVTVHRLASHYHWSEQDIFAVPDWRRQQYLKLTGEAEK